jgi:hypothetical protein
MSEEVVQDSQVEDVSQAPMEQPQGSAPAQEAPQQVTPDYWGAFKQLPGFAGKDDREVASTLYQAMEREQAASRALQQYQQVMPVAQEYLKYRPEFEQWRKAQSQQQQQTEQVKKWWNPPEIKDSYKTWLTRDEHGREVIHENAPPEARAALIERQQYAADFARKFLENPEQALGPMFEEQVNARVQQAIEQFGSQQKDEGLVSLIEQENASWLRDQQGNYTPEAESVRQYIDQAAADGIQGVEQRWQWAKTALERDVLLQRIDQLEARISQSGQAQPAQPVAPPPAANTAQQNMEYLRREATRRPSRSAGSAVADGSVPRPKRSFTEMLAETASNRGIL